MLPSSYAVSGVKTSEEFAIAFAAGCGGEVVASGVLQPGPFALFGLPFLLPMLKQARSEGRTWYYGDHGYFRRKLYFRVTKNAYQRLEIGDTNPDRLKAMKLEIKPWNKNGRHVLICPPDPVYAARQGFDDKLWTRNVIARLRTRTDRHFLVRHREGAESFYRTLWEQVRNAHAVVTHHSNAAVEALMYGCPVFVTGYCAARPMACTDLDLIESPVYPDREPWAASLANSQWTLDEMHAGVAWEMLERNRP